MKKLLILTVFALVALTSCRKDYVCTFEDNPIIPSLQYPDLTKSEAAELQDACEASGGVWSVD
jgi:hypothetical protein